MSRNTRTEYRARRVPVLGKPTKPIRNTRPKIGRNEECPCGSGKKFKRCHLK
jgi:uncharacterized protein YecA (UPF0149 family)